MKNQGQEQQSDQNLNEKQYRIHDLRFSKNEEPIQYRKFANK